MHYEAFPQYWINHLSFQLRKQLEQAFSAQGQRATAEEWSMLLILNKHGALSPRDLSQLTLRDPTTVSRLLDRLETRELITRVRVRKDRRVVDIEMTDAGRALFANLAAIARVVIERSLDGISDSDIAQTIKTLQQMSANLTATERSEDV